MRGRGWATMRRPCSYCGTRIRASMLARHERVCASNPAAARCAVAECERRDLKAFGLCRMHYTRLRRHGSTADPLRGRLDFRREPHPPTSVERFWQKVEPEPNTGCWLWIGNANKLGYGRFEKAPAHRFLWELQHGPVPAGLELDHLCCTPSCVNPNHLEAVPHRENSRRALLRTHCARGHELRDDTVYVRPNGSRRCRECRRIEKSAWDARHPRPSEVQTA